MGNDVQRPRAPQKSMKLATVSKVPKPNKSTKLLPSLSSPHGSLSAAYRPDSSIDASSTFHASNTPATKHTDPDVQAMEMKNGIIGKRIKPRVIKIAADFWNQHVDSKPMAEKLELGCSIFFEMMAQSAEIKRILKRTLLSQQSIEMASLKFLDMMAWLLRSLIRTDVELSASLTKLGAMHRKMGITVDHFDAMLKAMHGTFSYYFPVRYSIQIKYAIDRIFALATRVMNGQNINDAYALNDGMKDGAFLTSLRFCLQSNIGREYLYRFLQQTFCDEIAIFLQSMKKFRQQTSDKERFMVARDVVKSCIEADAVFAVNVSYDLREETLHTMKQLERVFSEKGDLAVSKDLFAAVELEINKLVMENHWIRFVQTFKHMDDAHCK